MSRRNASFTTKEKLAIVEYSFQHGNRAAGRHFNCYESNVRYWKKQYDKLKTLPANKRADRGKGAKFPDLENELYHWICEKRDSGIGVSTTEIRMRAIQLHKSNSEVEFKASLCWCQRFMKRHDLSVRRRTTIAQKLPVDYADKVTDFQKFVIKIRKEFNIDPSRIGNADQTPLTFDLPSDTTVTHVNDKTVSIRTTGNEKNRFTVMLGCMGDGTKLPPYVIFKRKTMPKLTFPKGIIVRVHEKGWMTDATMKEWLRVVWGRRPNTRQHSLLVLDSFRCHRSDFVKEIVRSDKTQLAVIPGGMTSILQPLDVGVNRPMKMIMKKKWNEWMNDESQHTYTKGGRMRKPEMDVICKWIIEAWNDIDPNIIVRSFLKCCLTNSMDGSEDDLIWEMEEPRDYIEEDDDPMDIIYNEHDFDAEAFFKSDDDDDEDDFLGFAPH